MQDQNIKVFFLPSVFLEIQNVVFNGTAVINEIAEPTFLFLMQNYERLIII